MKEKRKEAPDKMKINQHKIGANFGVKEKAFSIRFMGNEAEFYCLMKKTFFLYFFRASN